ncbi:MAG: RNA-binding S4 domain-containing protein [Azoarcus sp.]|nr:RNA-binding S4 domain-containing protein [Azoarcus sp.]
MTQTTLATVRLDKWLWAARFFRHRAQATEAVEGGRVHLNGQATKPAKAVKLGDTVEITIGEQHFTVEVLALSEKRGPATVAQALYRESEESRAERQKVRELKAMAAAPGGDARGRPSKQDRRRRARFEQGFG